jgi:hypothetical protein
LSPSLSPSVSPSVSPSPAGFKPHFTIGRFYGKIHAGSIKLTPKFSKSASFKPNLSISKVTPKFNKSGNLKPNLKIGNN